MHMYGECSRKNRLLLTPLRWSDGDEPPERRRILQKINEQSFRIFDSFNEDFENPPNKIKKLLEISLTFAHNIVIYHL